MRKLNGALINLATVTEHTKMMCNDQNVLKIINYLVVGLFSYPSALPPQ